MDDVSMTDHRHAAAVLSCVQLTWPQDPEVLCVARKEFSGSAPIKPIECPNTNFLKGVKWSPDGSCLLTASDDNWLRIFDLPQDIMTAPALSTASSLPLGRNPPNATSSSVAADAPVTATATAGGVSGAGVSTTQQPAAPQASIPLRGASAAAAVVALPAEDSVGAGLRVQEGETIYDFCWFPAMTVADPISCCFASTCRGHPVHLWDACSGALRCTYRGYNDVDEVTAAYSVAFAPDGSRLAAGYGKWLLLFDVTRPGRDYAAKITTHKKRQPESVRGMLSCLAYARDGTALAFGSYSGSIGIMDPRTKEHALTLSGHRGGVTQVQFSPDGCYLYSGARQDPHVLCWDVRYAPGEVYRMARDTGATNQRIGFSIEPCGRHLVTGGCEGTVKVFDLRTGALAHEFRAADDTVNGVDVHPNLPLLATASGHRRYPLRPHSDSSSSSSGSSSSESDVEPRPRPAPLPGAPSTARPPPHGTTGRRKRRKQELGGSDQRPGGDAPPGLSNALVVWRCSYTYADYAASAAEHQDAAAAEAAMVAGGAGEEGAHAAAGPPPTAAATVEAAADAAPGSDAHVEDGGPGAGALSP